MSRFRTGFGFDVHQLVPGRDLIIGGINIPFAKGAAGHSDADVLIHAVADALLGAMALGDLGTHFPDTDPAFKNVKSTEILKRVFQMVSARDYRISNIDSTVVLQQPKLNSYIPDMRALIGEILQLGIEEVSVKATTNEYMGFVGRGEGVAAYAVVLLTR